VKITTFITVWSGINIFLVIWYFIFGISWLVLLPVFLALGLMFFISSKKTGFNFSHYFKKNIFDWSGVLILVGDLFLFFCYFLARTDQALSSPWLVLSPAVFILFAALTWMWFLRSWRQSGNLFDFLILFGHFLAAFSVATIIYKVGFGFDPFIHRAAETSLFRLGEIEPKQILYSGQYVLVSTLAHLPGLSVVLIDKWLVPVLAAMTLPWVISTGLKEGYGVENSTRWVPTLLIIPFLPLVFTVPNNLVFLYGSWMIFLWPLALNGKQTKISFLILGLAALFTHPLLGLPIFLWAACLFFANNKSKNIIFLCLFFVLLAVSLPAAFAARNIMAGQLAFYSLDFWHRLDLFLGLFTDPYKHDYFPVPFFWQALYWFKLFFYPVLTIGSLSVVWFLERKSRPVFIWLATFLFGSLISIFFISTLFVFKDVIYYEQSEFALRYVQFLFFLGLPGLVVILDRFTKEDNSRFVFVSLVLSILVAVGWYFSYPQSNPKVLFSGPSVSAADVEAVRLVNELTEGEKYFVLSNQMTSAAALQEFGFANYLKTTDNQEILWYPLPTGGSLYQYFLSMSFGVPSRELILETMNFTGVDQGYFLVSDYWPGSGQLIETIKPFADKLFSVKNDAIIIFEFKK